MSNTLKITQEKLGKTYHDLEFLLECLKEVLIEAGESHLAEYIPWLNSNTQIKPENFTEKHTQLYSIAFHILNMVEENGAVQTRRKHENNSLQSINGLWADSIQTLKSKGIKEKQIASELANIHIEPVLTAHPTEAKRAIVLEYHRSLYLLLVQRENKMYTEKEQNEIRRKIKVELDRIWRTGEIYLEKPDLKSELKNIVHYMTTVFPEVIPILDSRFLQGWQEAGFSLESVNTFDKLPKISFGDWVGGDRDGHPFVTAEITKYTLETLKSNSVNLIRNKLLKLQRNLSFNFHFKDTPETLKERILFLSKEQGKSESLELPENSREILRFYIDLLIAKLPDDFAFDLNLIGKIPYKNHFELLDDLVFLREALFQSGAVSIAYADLREVLRTVQTFGFFLAHLDIRQNSKFHDAALAILMDQSMLNGKDFLTWNEEQRLSFMNQELLSARPFTPYSAHLKDEAKAVVDCLRTVATYVEENESHGIGSLIVSMTRSLSDLLIVYLLAREAGLVINTDKGLVCRLPVVPLFETIEDLQASPEIMEAFLNHPFTQRSLKFQKEERKESSYCQQIMIGYSDSNKDGGIMASQWNLSLAQTKLAEIGKKHNVKIRFFHGKGGSISRGAGPTNWFLKTLPPNTISGEMRLTEQGETIAQKYANLINASFNLELLMAGTTCKTILDKYSKPEKDKFDVILQKLSANSQKFYQGLINDKNFIGFFSQATPIDVIENSKIGSRPARRTGKRSLADLRAIPWVFSWGQSRFNITSWYGVGSTLEEFSIKFPKEFDLLKAYTSEDTLARYIFTNVDTSLAATDEIIFKAYADLVEDEEVKAHILGKIYSEFEKTKKMLQIIFQKPFEERRSLHHVSNILRAEALNNLHYQQIALLKKWRASKNEFPDSEETQNLLLQLLVTVNGIASALRSTG